MPFRFLHASDLHIGRHFAAIPQAADGNIRGRLVEARQTAVQWLAAAARIHGARDILLAGDTFDTPTPSAQMLGQTRAMMAEAADLTWWLLPGNHDNLREGEPLWDSLRGVANLRVLDTTEPREMAEGVWLLPCPVEWRSAGRDPSAHLPGIDTPEGALRIGLAHGAITDFTESGAAIPPDRDRTARLDYLALGDWHGRMAVSPRVQYCGSPEQDQFKHDRRGVALAVTLDAPGAAPEVAEVETGLFLWREIALALAPRQDAAAALAEALPVAGRRDTMIRLRAGGWAGLPEQAALREAAARIGVEFAHFELDLRGLGTQYETADLDAIDRGGALRRAAEALRAEAGDQGKPAEARTVAADALARLYGYVREAGA
jgi:hypothetical protein